VSALCDRCVILDAGMILQEGPTATVLSQPQTERVAAILGVQSEFP